MLWIRLPLLILLAFSATACGKRDLYMIKKDGKVVSPKQDTASPATGAEAAAPAPLVYQLIFATTEDGCGDTRMPNLLEPVPRPNYTPGLREAFQNASLYRLVKGGESLAAVSATGQVYAGYCDGEDMHVDVTFPTAPAWEGDYELFFSGLDHNGQKAKADSVRFTVGKSGRN